MNFAKAIRRRVFQGHFHKPLISKVKFFRASEIWLITFQVVCCWLRITGKAHTHVGGKTAKRLDRSAWGCYNCCAGLLGAVLVVLMDHGGHPDTLEVAASTLMRHMHCSILALAAERVSRDTAIWVEPPTLANLFDAERAVQPRRRAPRPSPEGQGGR